MASTAGEPRRPEGGTRRRRGRPRLVQAVPELEPREEILQHAAALFSTKGVAATRVADIAASVGVSPPAIYYHFENLDAIVETLLTYVVEESAAFATAAAAGTASCTERLGALIHQHVERLTSGPYDLWFVAGLSDEDARRFPAIAHHAAGWRAAAARLVEEGRERGELRDVDPALAVAAVSGLVYGALELRHRRRPVDAATVADLAVAALAPPPSGRQHA
jgi:AcrR family transcriptional regulator